MKNLVIAALGVTSFAGVAVADTPPPADALPLSGILAQVEADNDLRYIEEVEWDDDGYWEVEFIREDGGKVKLKIDPLTGTPR